ncbi:hypothetical protein OF83DRAFT_509271 [Amylostereum chailletii]|nr:hypothetical protein OF83DRAFT_509271 [Amylostereum chailletii]
MSPAPLPSFAGGVGLALSAHSLLTLNGSVFGISGFLHRAVKGNPEALIGVSALLIGGFVVGKLENVGPRLVSTSLLPLLASGFLVGVGTKLGNGCTSGHMLCGLSRLSTRSVVATATFFTTASITTYLYHRSIPVAETMQNGLGTDDTTLLAASAVSLLIAWTASYLTPSSSPPQEASAVPRLPVQFFTAASFAFSLRVSKLVDPQRVLSFLLLPFHSAFDPSLVYLALGALPLLSILYHKGAQKICSSQGVDGRLVLGAALFGVGWGMEGICPGPGLVNLGQAVATGSGVQPLVAWIAAVVAGGLMVPS